MIALSWVLPVRFTSTYRVGSVDGPKQTTSWWQWRGKTYRVKRS